MLAAFHFACPLRKVYAKNSPFWSKRLEKLRRKTRRLFNKARHRKAESDWQNYKLARKEFKRSLRAAKRKSWLKFIDEVKDLKATAKLGRALAKDPVYPEMLKREDGSYTKSNEEVVDLLTQTHFPGVRLGQSTEPQPVRVPNATDWNVAATIITNRRLEWAISTFKPFKSPGSDGIYPVVLQRASRVILKPLKGILQAVLAMGYIPESWREVLVRSGCFEEVLGSLMSAAVRMVEVWCEESGLTVNPEKTGLILFTKKRKCVPLKMPKLFGISLKLTERVKYLGVILDK